MSVSRWAEEWFGDNAQELRVRVPRALGLAQGDAVAAQTASGSRKRMTYGHTMAVRQHEQMQAQLADLPGVEPFHPTGAPYDLVRLGTDGPILMPWRFATDSTTSHDQARMKPSGVRQNLLASKKEPDQLTLEHAAMSDEELEEHLTQLQMLDKQLLRWSRVVTIGYSSNVDGLYRLGWGEVELNADGGVAWPHWEVLPLPGAGESQTGAGTTSSARTRSLAAVSAVPRRPRFDDAPLDDDFGLTARNHLSGEPQQEAAPETPETGTEDGGS